MSYLYLLGSFILVAFGQPAWMPSLGIFAASLGFALFWKACVSFESPKSRFILATVWFTSVQMVQLSWMTSMEYMGPLILFVYLMLVVGVGAQFGLLTLLLRTNVKPLYIVAIAGCWTIFEWARIFFLSGYTWNPVGLLLASNPYSIQFASLFGIYGLSFWVILVNLLAFHKKIAIFAVAALLPYGFGFVHQLVIENRYATDRTITAALIQTAIRPEQKDSIFGREQQMIPVFDQWERLLNTMDEKKVDLIVFPEAAVPYAANKFYYPLDWVQDLWKSRFGKEHFSDFPPLDHPYAAMRDREMKVNNAFIVQSIANHYGAHVIMGMEDQEPGKKYNAAFHFSPEGIKPQRYIKRILLPITEYIPFTKWKSFSRFVARQFGIYSSFEKGDEVKIFQASVPIGVSICIEETFSHLIRGLRRSGAELFVNITNDVWFPSTKLPQQHFDHGRIRAVENGVYVLRACVTGVTGGVDCFGRPLAQLPVSESKAEALYLTLPICSYPTLYTLLGDWAILGISLFAILSVALNRNLR